MRILYSFVLLIGLLVATPDSQAQTRPTADSVFQSSVQEILQNKPLDDTDNQVEVASKFAQSQEQAAAIVAVFTQQDIRTWGVRDLSDILRMVAGFEFGIDVQSLYGVGFRGIWGHEGKVLLMVDGMSMNCFGYGNTNFIGTYPAAMIDKVEIIRGPGSALYGGFAEVAVINVLTRKGREINGIQASTSGGLLGNQLLYGGNISAGLRKNDIELTAHIGYNQTPTSSSTYTGFDGSTLLMSNESASRAWQHIIGKARIKNFNFTYQRTTTNFLAQTGFGSVLQHSSGLYTNHLNNYIQNIQFTYEQPIGTKWKIASNIDINSGNAISTATTPTLDKDKNGNLVYLNTADLWQNESMLGLRYKGEVSANYIDQKIGNIILGMGYQIDRIASKSATGLRGLQISPNPADTTDTHALPTSFVYFQYNKQIGKIGITAGSRFEQTGFGNAAAPRLGITYLQDRLNLKLLYGRAFRVPLLYQAFSRQYAYAKGGLLPEVASTIEMEIGYKFSKYLRAGLNGFWIDIEKPITYIGLDNSYQNFGQIRSVGLEGNMRLDMATWGVLVNFAYTKPLAEGTSPDFMTADHNNFLAMPPLKINLGLFYKWKKVVVAPTLTYLSERYGQAANKPADPRFNTSYPSVLLLNCNLQLNKIIPYIDLMLTVHNILESNYLLIQPYYGGHAPIPLLNRQFTLTAFLKIN